MHGGALRIDPERKLHLTASRDAVVRYEETFRPGSVHKKFPKFDFPACVASGTFEF